MVYNPSDLVIKASGNQAVNVNPTHGVDFKITNRGSDWLWACFSVFGFLTALYTLLLFLNRVGNRFKKVVYASIVWIGIVMTFNYYAMASNLGWAGINAEFNNITVSNQSANPGVRQIFYTKFIAWVLSWPAYILIIEASSLEGDFDGARLFDLLEAYLIQVGGLEVLSIGLLLSSLIKSTYKWGFWVFAASGVITYSAFFVYRHIFQLYTRGLKLLILFVSIVVILLYPVAYALSDGGNVIQPDAAAVFFGILDWCSFVILPIFISWVSCSGSASFLPTIFKERKLPEKPAADTEKQEPASIRASGETEIPEVVDTGDSEEST
ncbi:related to 30 kDa heat shock protein [Saccharomycodes ludwigii]|uniref:Related to 30 kDa heat shock protein n=1 Tax=Saccharomycodes ludwigii TaxID=36035 RepID=A0A376B144_9ASCO|nr:hypothetical protein SCDLUD_000731 [Saccharomycodes ludwigii]KAH3903119.1 hypothetical protein SCDLUD_000731 [Saccharomycodes ludwigii]SSD58362.1 related to 30 kDa heat shock protein [Saccharomycodes ludwigii]